MFFCPLIFIKLQKNDINILKYTFIVKIKWGVIMDIILLIISILPVVILSYFIYKKDRNKEPLKILLKLFFGGVLSIFITLIVSSILEIFFPFFESNYADLNLIELVVYTFIGVALIEEGSKFIILYNFSYNSKDFDEFYDMLMYGAYVSLGFACLENILYVFQNGMATAIIRGIASVPGHAFFGIFMGYYLGLAKIASLNKNKRLENKNKMLSLLVPTLFHGIFDYCLFSGKMILLFIFLIFLILLYINAFKKLNRVSKINKKLFYKNNYCPNCGFKVNSNYCPNCGRKNE